MIAHFLSDFLFQTREMATKKSYEVKYLLQHGAILATVFTVLLLDPIFAITNAVVHITIDWNIWRLYRFIRANESSNFKYWEDQLFYFTIGLDQLLHLLTITILVSILK